MISLFYIPLQFCGEFEKKKFMKSSEECGNDRIKKFEDSVDESDLW